MGNGGKWWEIFMQEFDGITIIPAEKYAAPDTVFSTDSCLRGCGGWNNGHAFHTTFPDWIKQRKDIHINELELLAVIIAVKKWANAIKNRNILAYCDNSVTIDVINKGAATNRFSQECLRELCYVLAKANAVVKLVYITTKDNFLSDNLSRWHNKQARDKFWEQTKDIKVTFENIRDEDFKFIYYFYILFAGAELEQLKIDMRRSQQRAYAIGSFSNFNTQWVTYLSFCVKFSLVALRATTTTLTWYAQFLSKKLKSHQSLISYLVGAKKLHALLGHTVAGF